MPNILSANDFLPWIDQPCRVSAEGYVFDLTILAVEEKSHLKWPEANRAPFSVLLTGPLDPSFEFGLLNIEVATGLLAESVHIERSSPPAGLEPQAAYYQILFN